MGVNIDDIKKGQRYRYRHADRGIDEIVEITFVKVYNNEKGQKGPHIQARRQSGEVTTISSRKLFDVNAPTLSLMQHLPEVAEVAKTIDDEWWARAGKSNTVTVDADDFHHYAGDEQEISFANDSELMFAQRIDKEGLSWEHEPKLFMFADPENPRHPKAFLPDIYLPELDMYVELTTAKLGSVSAKNIKLRAMNSQYPSDRVLLVRRSAFAALMEADELAPMIERLYEHQQARMGFEEQIHSATSL